MVKTLIQTLKENGHNFIIHKQKYTSKDPATYRVAKCCKCGCTGRYYKKTSPDHIFIGVEYFIRTNPTHCDRYLQQDINDGTSFVTGKLKRKYIKLTRLK